MTERENTCLSLMRCVSSNFRGGLRTGDVILFERVTEQDRKDLVLHVLIFRDRG